MRDDAKLALIASISEELIDFVIRKYRVGSLNDFTCPIHRRLAVALGKFTEAEQVVTDESGVTTSDPLV